MRNVMVRCIFSALSVGLYLVGVLSQEIHRYPWTDQQVLADEWKPFVPGFTQQRQFDTYHARPDSSRQFFGKAPEPIQQNLYKKSFQTAASANNLEPYVVPPILGSFNTFGLQSIQARNPLLEKNIKDNQFLDQGSHLQPKFYPNPQPQRFPPAFGHQTQYLPQQQPPQPQHQPQHPPQHQHQYYNQYRLEAPPKQQPLAQSPSRTIQTSVQVFPPNAPNVQNHYQPNAYFLGAPQKQENFEDDSQTRKTYQRPNEFLLNTNNIATIYGSRDPSLNIPPPALKPTPFIRNEQTQDHFLYDNVNIKPVQRYESLNTYKRPYDLPPKHIEIKKPEDNPSKQVYEQLAQFGRPFTLPKESATEYTRIKPAPEETQDYEPEPYKKEKIKTSQKTTYGHPVAFQETTSNIVDYEPGKLQSVKTVTYTPQRDVLQFNEHDVTNLKHQNDKYSSHTRAPFLPTPTESEDDGSYGFQGYTTPPQKLTSILPKNHKYVSIQHPTRTRYQQNYLNQEAPTSIKYTTTEQQIANDQSQNVDYEQDTQYETTTRKIAGRRRKPSKATKNKDQRYKFPTFAEATSSTTVSEYQNDISTSEAPVQHTTKKKQTKPTTSKPEDDYPNYPQYVKQENYPQENYPQYVKQENYPKEYFQNTQKQENYPKEYNQNTQQQENYPKEYHQNTQKQENYPKEYYQNTQKQENYPKEYFQNTQKQENYPKEYFQNTNTEDNADPVEYFSSEKEEKENYPKTLTSLSTTTTTTPEPTTSLPKVRINKNKYSNATRPRFSVKDYKRTSTISPSSSTTEASTEESADKPVRKFAFATRSKNKTETVKPSEESSTSESLRKYKPRTRPSKYRTTTTTVATDTTTERVNTFKPATANRQKASTSKYYNRFRTTTEITSNDAEEPSVASSDKKPIKTMLFSAKRTSLLRSKSTTPKVEESEEHKPDTKLDKIDDASQTSLMTSSEEQEIMKKNEQPEPEVSEEDFSDMIDLKENQVTSTSASEIEDRMDDADRVSKVSSLTSLDESDIPLSFFQKWNSNDNSHQ